MAFKEKYKKIAELGRGAFGVAYLVQHREGAKVKLAAKELHLSHMSAQEQRATKGEAELLKNLEHPSIIGYHDSILDGSRLFIIMEFADGGDLAGRIKEKKEKEELFKESGIMLIFTQLVLALHYIHGKRILHRDIKPMNIFLTKQGAVKLGDFGIARVIDGYSDVAKTTIGTPYYISPEVCKREPYGTKSDLWALGVVTYELAALRVPFLAQCLPAVAMAICQSDPAPISSKYTSNFRNIVIALLQKQPDKRPSLKEVLSIPDVQISLEKVEDRFMSTNVRPEKADRSDRFGGGDSSSCQQPEDRTRRGPEDQARKRDREVVDVTQLPADLREQSRGSIREEAPAGKPTACINDKYDDFGGRTKHRSGDDKTPTTARRHAEGPPGHRREVEPHGSIEAQRAPSEFRAAGKPCASQETGLKDAFAWDCDRSREQGRDLNSREERKRLQELERARLQALEDQRMVKERVRQRQEDGMVSGGAISSRRGSADHGARRPSTAFERRPSFANDDAELEELERARVQALEDQRSAKDRMRQRQGDAAVPGLVPARRGSVDHGPRRPSTAFERRPSMSNEDGDLEAAHREARLHRARAARKKEQERAELEALERARIAAAEDRRLARERMKAHSEIVGSESTGDNIEQPRARRGSHPCEEMDSGSALPTRDVQARKREQEKARLQELERARIAAIEDRRLAKERMRARNAESSPAASEGNGEITALPDDFGVGADLQADGPESRTSSKARRKSFEGCAAELSEQVCAMRSEEREGEPSRTSETEARRVEDERSHLEELEKARLQIAQERKRARERWRSRSKEAAEPVDSAEVVDHAGAVDDAERTQMPAPTMARVSSENSVPEAPPEVVEDGMYEKPDLELTQWPSDDDDEAAKHEGLNPALKDSLSFTVTGGLSGVSCDSPVREDPATTQAKACDEAEEPDSSLQVLWQRESRKCATLAALERLRAQTQEERRRLTERLRGESGEPFGLRFESKTVCKGAIKDEDSSESARASGSKTFTPKARKPTSKEAPRVEKDAAAEESSRSSKESTATRRKPSLHTPEEVERTRRESVEEKRRMKERFMARHAECAADADGAVVRRHTGDYHHKASRQATASRLKPDDGVVEVSPGEVTEASPSTARKAELPSDSPSTVCPSSSGDKEMFADVQSSAASEVWIGCASQPEDQATDAKESMEETLLPAAVPGSSSSKREAYAPNAFLSSDGARDEPPPLVQYFRFRQECGLSRPEQSTLEETMLPDKASPTAATNVPQAPLTYFKEPASASSCSEGNIEASARRRSFTIDAAPTQAPAAESVDVCGADVAAETVKFAERSARKNLGSEDDELEAVDGQRDEQCDATIDGEAQTSDRTCPRLPSGALKGSERDLQRIRSDSTTPRSQAGGARSGRSTNPDVPTPTSFCAAAQASSPKQTPTNSPRSTATSVAMTPSRKVATLDLNDDEDGCSLAAMTAPGGSGLSSTRGQPCEAWRRADQVEARRQELLREQRQKTRDYLKQRPVYTTASATPPLPCSTAKWHQTSPTKSGILVEGACSDKDEESEIESY